MLYVSHVLPVGKVGNQTSLGKSGLLEIILSLGHTCQIQLGNGLGFRALKEGCGVVSGVAVFVA